MWCATQYEYLDLETSPDNSSVNTDKKILLHNISKKCNYIPPFHTGTLHLTLITQVCKNYEKKKGGGQMKSYSCNRPWRLIGLWNIEAPTFSRKSAHRWQWGCQPYVPATLYPPERFLVRISVWGWVDPTIILWLEGLHKLKNSNDLIWIWTCNLPACSIVPQWISQNFIKGKNTDFFLNFSSKTGSM
jgi:hypothetical protein